MIPEAATLPRPRFFWPGLLVALPLLILAGLAVAGLRSRWQARWAEAQEEAQRTVDRTGRELESILTEATTRLQPVRLYPALPVPPKEVSPAWLEAVQSNDPNAFRALRDAPEPAWTDAGLPAAALAAWAVYAREPTAENAPVLVDIVIHRWPSAVSPVILTKAMELARSEGPVPEILSGSQNAWQASEALRALVQRHPAAADGDVWVVDAGQLRLIRRKAGEIAVTDPGPDLNRLTESTPDSRLPAWMTLSLWKDGQHLGPAPSPPSPRILAESRGLINVRADLTDPDKLYAPLRSEIGWAASLIGAATLAAGSGLWLSRRALHREQRLYALKSQFVASVSHELRAPIGSVRLMAEALSSGTVEGEAARTFHRLLAQEGARLSALIENVLDFSRIESGRKSYQFEETDLPALLRDTIALLGPRAAPRGITLRLECAPLSQVPEVDAPAIQQAVINLLDNALKFSPDQGVITVTLTDYGPQGWSLAITDEGPGIPPAEHQRIFERFHRLGNELRRETQGAGIGLSLVQHIIEAHHGTITVKNRTPKGTGFTLHFPWPNHK
jgi:signal transduction histidine kinase